MRFYGEDITSGADLVLDGNADGSIWITNYVKQGTSTLVCGYSSGWDDLADGGLGAPINPISFDDFETIVIDCGSAINFAAIDVEGIVLASPDGTATFNDTAAAGTEADPETGVFAGDGESINFIWYVEAATCAGCNHSYLVIYSDDTIDPVALPPGAWFRDTRAVINADGSTYTFASYTEQFNYSDNDRTTGSDGEIWYQDQILQ